VGETGAPPVFLVVEDEAPNRALLRAVLGRSTDQRVRDAVLLEAPDLLTARRVLAEAPVTLLLLDVRLPDGNGLTLARELHERPPGRRPKVLVLSASVLPSERDAALRAGADAFLGKPYRPSDLIDAIRALLDAPAPGDERRRDA
jgi:two-component system KDP operon response regulator KdpE